MNRRVAVMVAFLALVLALVPGSEVLGGSQWFYKLRAVDGVDNDNFGRAVAISGTTAIVGADDDWNGSSTGSAHLYDCLTGAQIAKLMHDDGVGYDWFGYSVAIDGPVAIVGAVFNADVGGPRSGSAYLFDSATGTQIARLHPTGGEVEDFFGHSVAVDGTVAIVGAHGDNDNGTNSGSAYLYDSTTGDLITKLAPLDPAEGDNFGISVGVSGNTAVVGSYGDQDNGYASGSAYLFDCTTGEQLAKLLPDDGEVADRFGCSVAIDGTTAIIGARADDDNGPNAGAAYLFDTVTGAQVGKLLADDGETYDYLGEAVAISGTLAVVGADSDDDNGNLSGAAYLFDCTTGDQLAKLLAADGAPSDSYGWAVAVSGSIVIIGAPHDDGTGPRTGSAYLYNSWPPAPTVSASLSCVPSGGTVPFGSLMTVTLDSLHPTQSRQVAGRISATLASGNVIPDWRTGAYELIPGTSHLTSWVLSVPAYDALIGENHFELLVEDMTPAPFNLPPYPMSGTTAGDNCTVTGVEP